MTVEERLTAAEKELTVAKDMLAAAEAKLEAAEATLARMRAFANPDRPDRYTIAIARADGEFKSFVSWFSASKVAAAEEDYRRRLGHATKAINNGPRELTCCEEAVADLLAGREPR